MASTTALMRERVHTVPLLLLGCESKLPARSLETGKLKSSFILAAPAMSRSFVIFRQQSNRSFWC